MGRTQRLPAGGQGWMAGWAEAGPRARWGRSQIVGGGWEEEDGVMAGGGGCCCCVPAASLLPQQPSGGSSSPIMPRKDVELKRTPMMF